MEIRIHKVRLGEISPGEVASERFVPGRSALERSASWRFAPVRATLERSVSDSSALDRSALERFAPERSGSLERFSPLEEFQGALATLMAYWVTPFLGARLPLLTYCLPQHVAYHIGGGG
jgi:hypothetical protein